MEVSKPQLEIAVDSLQGALIAQSGGADRVELCSHLPCGGLTPGAGLLELVCDQLNIPVHVLIRPRPGNFCYNDHEVATMCQSILLAQKAGAMGVVIGCVDEKGQLQQTHLKRMMEAATNSRLTFHRVFDLMPNPLETIDQLIQMHFDLLLTSGQAPSADHGKTLIKHLIDHAGTDLRIMPGAGVNSENIVSICKSTRCQDIHSSAKVLAEDSTILNDDLGITGDEPLYETGLENVRRMRAALDQAFKSIEPF